MFTSDDLIFSYTNREAVEDGALVQVDQKLSSEASILFPVYITEAVWKRYVEVPPGLTGCQDLQGRLWDILFMFAWEARKCSNPTLQFRFTCQIPDSSEEEPNEKKTGVPFQFREVTLKAVIAARDIDDPSPAIFIMKPSED